VTWVRCDERVGIDGLIWIEDQLLAAWVAALPTEAAARVATPEEGIALREQAVRRRLVAAGLPALAQQGYVDMLCVR
jgi:hypothetical protein